LFADLFSVVVSGFRKSSELLRLRASLWECTKASMFDGGCLRRSLSTWLLTKLTVGGNIFSICTGDANEPLPLFAGLLRLLECLGEVLAGRLEVIRLNKRLGLEGEWALEPDTERSKVLLDVGERKAEDGLG